jgi:hypothetical protein
MLINMILMGVVEMPIMEITDMVAMLDGGVAATRAVLVGMVFMLWMIAAHRWDS